MEGFNNVVQSDVLVIGGGLAGCLAAIEAKEVLGQDARVVIVDKSRIAKSGQSTFAAGIFTVFDPGQDDLDVWLREIIARGEYLSDQAWCKQMFEQTMPIAQDIEKWAAGYRKLVFEKDANGNFVRRRSRGHVSTRNSMVNALSMMAVLRRKLVAKKVTIVERVMVTDLVQMDGSPVGAVGFNYWNDDTSLFHAKTMVLAASGSGFKSLYMGHQNLTGDLQAAAFEIGATFRNMEQFSTNSTSRFYDVHGLQIYVGIGGKFLNRLGEEFMWNYHPELGSRAPQQDLALAMCREVAEGRGPIYLDMRSASAADRQMCRGALPEAFRLWDRAGIDPFEQPLEWVPSFEGTLQAGGGLHINTRCETNLPRLYAAGDITSLPPHGTYSVGGINLAFSSVSGRVAGHNAAEEAKSAAPIDPATIGKKAYEVLRRSFAPLTRSERMSTEEAIKMLQQAMIPVNYGYLKSAEGIADTLQQIERVRQEILPQLAATSSHALVKAIEVRSMVTVARAMFTAAQFREESRGWHFRTDFPRTDNEKWLKWVMLSKDGESIRITTQQVETPFAAPAELYVIPPGVRRT
ncbi:MAG: FAD-binding protein [Chloroflexi bacterium]|nr:FAD-binding protein [Chloroflexota bacterium]